MVRRFSRSAKVSSTAMALLVLIALGFVFVLAGCGDDPVATTVSSATETSASGSPTTGGTPSTGGAEPQELTVSAASSLKAAFTEIGAAFDKANNAKTTFNFDASGTLQKQIESGAPVDVFASAAMKQANALVEGKYADQTSLRVFAGNEIVLVVPADSALGISSFEDLAKADVKKISYGDPAAAPHGVAAEEILTKLGLIEQVKSKVIYAANVAAALEYVSSGEVDAGIIFATEAATAGDKIKIVATSEAGWHSKIAYPICIVSASENKTIAQAFVDFVMGSEGQAVLQSKGFLPAPAQ